MKNDQASSEWTRILVEIRDDSPYTATFVDNGLQLYLASGGDTIESVVGTIHTPDDWQRLKRDAEQFGIWPSHVSF